MFNAKLKGQDITMIHGSIRMAKKQIKILLQFDILAELVRLGFKPGKVENALASAVSETTGKPVAVISSSLFTDLTEEAIRERGVDKFRGLENFDSPIFLLVNKLIAGGSSMLAGYDKVSGFFCITRKIFETILPAVPTLQYQRVLLELYIGRALLQALGSDDQELDKGDNEFVTGMLGPQKANELANIFNRIMERA